MKDNDVSQELSRLKHIRLLNSRTEGLDLDRILACKKAIIEGYKSTTIMPDVTIIAEGYDRQKHYQSIGIRKLIYTNEFNNPNYSWHIYFNQVGRIIAYGEQKYFQRMVGRHIRSHGKAISNTKTDFSILNKTISDMKKKQIFPDSIILPVSLSGDFMRNYFDCMDYQSGSSNTYNICESKLNIFFANKYAELRSILVFSSKAGIWYALKDPEVEQPLSIALGLSANRSDVVEYWVETRAYFRLTNRHYFARIRLSN